MWPKSGNISGNIKNEPLSGNPKNSHIQCGSYRKIIHSWSTIHILKNMKYVFWCFNLKIKKIKKSTYLNQTWICDTFIKYYISLMLP